MSSHTTHASSSVPSTVKCFEVLVRRPPARVGPVENHLPKRVGHRLLSPERFQAFFSDLLVASPTTLSYMDGPPINLYSVGSSKPNPCVYSYVEYVRVAYDSGRHAASGTLYYTGDASGPNEVKGGTT